MDFKDYGQFSVDDFLEDVFFSISVKSPTRESITFWQEFIDTNPANISEYYAAKKYLESSNSILPFISDQEIDRLWENIAAETGLNKAVPLHRKYVAAVVAVAASFIFGVVLWPVLKNSQANDVYEYANTAGNYSDAKEAQLILSDTRTVMIDQREAQITYAASAIIVSEEEIPKEESAQYNQLIIPKGKMSRLILSDGTKVWVNANTRIVYPVEFNRKQREIYVEGEIFLDVVHDKRPFIVKTQKLNIAVLGTRFNVCSYNDRDIQRIVLVEGSVKIEDDKKNKTILEPDQMYEVANGVSHVETVDVFRHTLWRERLFYFDKEKLENVTRHLSDYYGVTIACSERVGGIVCSGKLDLKENIDDVLSGLVKTVPVKLEYVEDGMYVIVLK